MDTKRTRKNNRNLKKIYKISEDKDKLCALTWEDIDFESKVINVRHSVFDKKKNENGRWYIGTTKTKSGEGQIHISPTLMKALVNFKNKQMELRLLYGKDYKYYHFLMKMQ